VVLSQRLSFITDHQSKDIFNQLRTSAKSPFKYYFKFDSYDLIGCSPEILVKATKDQIKTVPIAGTIKRGNNSTEDQELMEQLKNNPKEQSEHLMLVDLARNDLGKVSTIDSVKVKNFMGIKKYSHVFHLTTDVIGTKAKDNFEIIKAVFPAGTLTGAPKIRAMEIIDALEDRQRQLYGGAIGFIGFNESMELLINIRTLIKQQQRAYLQVGAGIVYDSNPALEYQETLDKRKSILNIFGGDINDHFNR
jgi:anthranilate synthase component 1